MGPYDEMIFPTDDEVKHWMSSITNVKEWSDESKKYILNTWKDLIETPDQVFVMESTTLTVNSCNNRTVDLLVSFRIFCMADWVQLEYLFLSVAVVICL